MKKIMRYILLLVLGAAAAFFSFHTAGKIKRTSDKSEATLDVMMEGLTSMHYQPQAINDTFSDHVYRLFIKRMDYTRKFLTARDIDKLKKYHYDLDEEVKAHSYKFFDEITGILLERTKQAQRFYKDVLSKPFAFDADETIELEADKIQWAKDTNDLKDAWRKQMKYQVLTRLSDLITAQEKASEKKDSVFEKKTIAQMEEDARKKVLKSTDEWFKRINEFDINERRAVYLNCIANTFDPHTEYFAPKEKANFDIAMTGQFEGIGAQLQEKDGDIKVASIVPGSASARQGQLKANDVIVKVGQGSAEPVDVTGMKIDNVVQMIRGKKGTEVRLTVKRPDGNTLVVPIIRDVVIIEETYARSAVIKTKDNIGYIRLPEFYADFNGKGARSSAKDVRDEIVKLKSQNVKAIILDLRDNGGGSLQEAIDMGGLFIEKGPIVQVKTKEGPANVLEDNDKDVAYDGPLLVMTNTNSASASEILAAAMQDYHRGIIIGSSHTFGKGTVQKFYDMDMFLNSAYSSYKPIGQVKITTQKFYRINGGATQIKGVVPDIVLPDAYALVDDFEKDLEYPLPWDEITPAKYEKWKKWDSQADKLRKNSSARVETSEAFKLVRQTAQRLKSQKEDSQETLNLEKYREKTKRIKDESKKLEEAMKEIPGMTVSSIPSDYNYVKSDSTRLARFNQFINNLKKDVYVFEAAQVAGEMK